MDVVITAAQHRYRYPGISWSILAGKARMDRNVSVNPAGKDNVKENVREIRATLRKVMQKLQLSGEILTPMN